MLPMPILQCNTNANANVNVIGVDMWVHVGLEFAADVILSCFLPRYSSTILIHFTS